MPQSFNQLRDNYPVEDRPEFYRSLGGEWPNLIENPNYQNTCAIRLSVAHYKGGRDIPSSYKEAQDGSGKAIVLKVETFKKFVESEYGTSSWGMSKRPGTAVGTGDLPSNSGIIVYHANWGDSTGHFDLWTGSSFVGPGDLNDIREGFALEMWFIL